MQLSSFYRPHIHARMQIYKYQIAIRERERTIKNNSCLFIYFFDRSKIIIIIIIFSLRIEIGDQSIDFLFSGKRVVFVRLTKSQLERDGQQRRLRTLNYS